MSGSIIDWFKSAFSSGLADGCERGILVLVSVILVAGPLMFGATGNWGFLTLLGLTLAVIVLWLIRLWADVSGRLLWPPVCTVAVLFVSYVIARYQTSDLEYVARGELLRVLVYGFVFLAIVNNLNRQESVTTVCLVMVFVGMVAALYAVFQGLTHAPHIWNVPRFPGYEHRESGPYMNPNHLAGYLEMVLPLGLAYILVGRLGHTVNVFLGYACLAMLAGIGVTFSRGGWIACGMSLLLFFALLLRKRQFRIPALILLALVAFGTYEFTQRTTRSQERFNEMVAQGKLANIRFDLWRPAFEMWKDHPWWGVGPGHFDYAFPPYRPTSVQTRPLRAHNDYVNTLADLGLAGFSLVMLAVVLVFAGVWRGGKFTQRGESVLGGQKSNRFALSLGAMTGLVAILLHSAVEFNMHVPANALAALTLMALLTINLRFATERYWVNPRWFGRVVATVIGLAGVIYLGQEGIRRARESYWLDKAAHASEFSEEQLGFLKRAAEAEPANADTPYQIGEILRARSFRAEPGYRAEARAALAWLRRARDINPTDAYIYLRIGMCLDWLNRSPEAAAYFQRALSLDPNSYYTDYFVGWHYLETRDYAAARDWFDRSLRILWTRWVADYYDLATRRLNEQSLKR